MSKEKVVKGSSLLRYLTKKIMKIIMLRLAYLGKLVLRTVIFSYTKALLLYGSQCCQDTQMDTLHGLFSL